MAEEKKKKDLFNALAPELQLEILHYLLCNSSTSQLHPQILATCRRMHDLGQDLAFQNGITVIYNINERPPIECVIVGGGETLAETFTQYPRLKDITTWKVSLVLD